MRTTAIEGQTLKHVEIYTDGACRGNPGPGGWGALLRHGQVERELRGAERETTNNRMELTAAIQGLNALREACQVDLFTDSQYLRRGISEWLPKWKLNGWRTADRKPVKNDDLWKLLEHESVRHQVRWHWVKGHSGHVDNERADRLANVAIDELLGRPVAQGG